MDVVWVNKEKNNGPEQNNRPQYYIKQPLLKFHLINWHPLRSTPEDHVKYEWKATVNARKVNHKYSHSDQLDIYLAFVQYIPRQFVLFEDINITARSMP